MDEHQLNIAIDFGTARTKAAFYNPSTEQAEVIRLGHSRVEHIPSLFHLSQVDGNDQVLFGEDAERAGRRDPAGLLIGVKSKIDDSRPIRRRSLTTRKDLLVDLFKHIREMSSMAHPEYATTVCCCQLTVPVGFEESKRDAIRDAASLAGFVNIELIEEPVAAARAWLRSNTKGIDTVQQVIVFDIGGGTCDYALLNHRSETFQVDDKVAPSGNANLGGNDLDDSLREVLEDEFPEEVSALGVASVCNELRLAREAWHLHRGESIELHFAGEQSLKVPRSLIEEETRTFCSLIIDDFERFLSKCESAGVPGDVPIAMIGGGSRILGLREALQAHTARPVLTWDQSDFAVVKGAVQLPDSRASGSYSEAEGEYRSAVKFAWGDGVIKADELKTLTESAEKSGLDNEKIAEIENEIIGMSKEEAYNKALFKEYENAFEQVKELLLEGRAMEALKLSEDAVIYSNLDAAWEAWAFSLEAIPSAKRIDESAERIASSVTDGGLAISAKVIANCIAYANESPSDELRSKLTEFETDNTYAKTYATLLLESPEAGKVSRVEEAEKRYPNSIPFKLIGIFQRLGVADEASLDELSRECSHMLGQMPYSPAVNGIRLLFDAMHFLGNDPNAPTQSPLQLSQEEREQLYHRLVTQANLTFYHKLGEVSFNITRERVEHIHEDIDDCIKSSFCPPEIRCFLHQINATIYEMTSGSEAALKEYRKLFEFQPTWEHAQRLMGCLHDVAGEKITDNPASSAKLIKEFRQLTNRFFDEILGDSENAPLVAVYLLQQLFCASLTAGLGDTLENARKIATKLIELDPESDVGRAVLFSTFYLDSVRSGQSINSSLVARVYPNFPEDVISTANDSYIHLDSDDVCLFLYDGAVIKPGQFGLALTLKKMVSQTRFSGGFQAHDWTKKPIERRVINSVEKWTITAGSTQEIFYADDVGYEFFEVIKKYLSEFHRIANKHETLEAPTKERLSKAQKKTSTKKAVKRKAEEQTVCNSCSKANPSSNKFCIFCGVPIDSSSPPSKWDLMEEYKHASPERKWEIFETFTKNRWGNPY